MTNANNVTDVLGLVILEGIAGVGCVIAGMKCGMAAVSIGSKGVV
jgi:hypothetical protein